MAKEKFNKKILENNNFECVMIGIMMILISLIGLIGKGPVGEFLQYCLLFLFGIYYILVYLFIIFLGVYLIVNKKFLKIKFNMYFVATILIFIILLSASNQVNETITLTNFAPLYLENLHS
jgi:xanthine/uracil permease